MTGAEFVRRVRRLGRRRGVLVVFQARRGKGSHGTLFYGRRKTIVPHRRKDLKAGTLNAMIEQLGLERSDVQ